MRTRQSICLKKVRYVSEADALAVAQSFGQTLHPYRCDRCARFHLTSRTKGKKRQSTEAVLLNSRASIHAAGALGTHEESQMTTKPKPGNQPDPTDMSGTFGAGPETQDIPDTQHSLEQEEEAARLGDFA